MSSKQKKAKNSNILFWGDEVRKKLQTELQATIAYAIYNSNEILGSGTSIKTPDIKQLL